MDHANTDTDLRIVHCALKVAVAQRDLLGSNLFDSYTGVTGATSPRRFEGRVLN